MIRTLGHRARCLGRCGACARGRFCVGGGGVTPDRLSKIGVNTYVMGNDCKDFNGGTTVDTVYQDIAYVSVSEASCTPCPA